MRVVLNENVLIYLLINFYCNKIIMSESGLKNENEPILKFDNVYGELEFFKKKCEIFEKELFKCQTQNKKNENIIKKLQDMIAVYGKTTNNTSNSLLLPSEFKNDWEVLVKDLIMEAFENVYDNCVILAQMVQDSIKLIYDESYSTIKEQIKVTINSLNITDTNLDKFLVKLRPIFQEYFSIIFICSENFICSIVEKLSKLIDSYIEKERVEDMTKDINSKGFKTFVQHSFKLCIYMILHEPQISLGINPYQSRYLIYHFFNKSDFLNIEGFGKENTPCLVIAPAPLLRGNFAYLGIKPAIYIVNTDDEKIISECEKNKKATPKVRSYSSSELVNIVDYNESKLKSNKKEDNDRDTHSNQPSPKFNVNKNIKFEVNLKEKQKNANNSVIGATTNKLVELNETDSNLNEGNI